MIKMSKRDYVLEMINELVPGDNKFYKVTNIQGDIYYIIVDVVSGWNDCIMYDISVISKEGAWIVSSLEDERDLPGTLEYDNVEEYEYSEFWNLLT